MRRTGITALLVAIALAGCTSGRSSASGTPPTVRVVAAENAWGDIARQIGGDRVKVTSLISDPNDDPHEYEATAEVAERVADANVVIENGLGYDDFVKKLLANTRSSHRRVLTVTEVLPGRKDGSRNPHLWYDLASIDSVADAIANTLAAASPGDTAAFAANLAAFKAAMEPVGRALQALRHSGGSVAYTERVAGYLVDESGLHNLTPPGFARAIEDGTEPGPADTQAMDKLLTGHRVAALLYNPQAESAATRHVRDLARANGIPVVDTSETMPKDEPDFQTWMLHLLQALRAALTP